MEKSDRQFPIPKRLTHFQPRRWTISRRLPGLLLVFFVAIGCDRDLLAREKDTTPYGEGLIVNVPFSESEVSQAVQETVQNGIIRGSKEYNKDEYISGAEVVASTRVFPDWTEGGRVFYKVRFKALDPRNFKNSGDVGTLAVRYIVQHQDENHTVLRIDARFVEDFRHTAHASNGSVESAEYKIIHDRLDAVALMKSETAEAEKEKQEFSSSKPAAKPGQAVLKDEPGTPPVPPSANGPTTEPPSQMALASEATPPISLEERVHELRKQVERTVKAPGAPLKSAPFHTATTLQALPAGTEVLVVVSTPYWFGVETHEGQHGWMLRDELEVLP